MPEFPRHRGRPAAFLGTSRLMLVAGVVVAAVAIVVIAAWYLWYRARGETPPPETRDETRPAEGRDETWDPRRRYD